MANFFNYKDNSVKTPLRLQKNKLIIFWGIIAPSLCTLVIWPFRSVIGVSSILIIYNLGVFLVAVKYGRTASNLAALLSVCTFAFFFTPAIFSFAITDINNISFAAMLVIANITSNLLDKIRLQSETAQKKENQATALYRLNRNLSDALNVQALVSTVATHLYEEFKVLSVLLLPDINNNIYYPNEAALTQSLRGVNLFIAQQVFKQHIGLTPGFKIINNIIYLPLQGAKRVVGVIAMQNIKPEFKTFLYTYLHQIALTLERLYLAKQAKEALLNAEAEALRNALLSAISHDLRTPLTRIMGLASTLMDDGLLSVEERLDFNKVIHDEAQRMSELMNKILDMARLSGGAIVLKREWYALEEIIGAALTRMENALGDRPVQIHLPKNLPLLWVDAVLMQQVLINLLENITKYTPAGSPIDISANLLPQSLTLAIADRGPGIVAGMEEKLFEKFYRVNAESTLDGIGLGLSLCRSIIQAHEGTIQAANRLDGGAVFTLVLPLHTPPPLPLDEPMAELA
jgi:K+-sensing histidine kinase KdpD